jgi:hypothetical protein
VPLIHNRPAVPSALATGEQIGERFILFGNGNLPCISFQAILQRDFQTPEKKSYNAGLLGLYSSTINGLQFAYT